MSSLVVGFPYTSHSKKSFLHSMTRRWISTGNAPSRKALARSSSVDLCSSPSWICSVTFGRSDISHPDASLSQPSSRQKKHCLPPHSGQAVPILTWLLAALAPPLPFCNGLQTHTVLTSTHFLVLGIPSFQSTSLISTDPVTLSALLSVNHNHHRSLIIIIRERDSQ